VLRNSSKAGNSLGSRKRGSQEEQAFQLKKAKGIHSSREAQKQAKQEGGGESKKMLQTEERGSRKSGRFLQGGKGNVLARKERGSVESWGGNQRKAK